MKLIASKPWHSAALTLYVDERLSMKKARAKLLEQGVVVTLRQVQHFLKRHGVLRMLNLGVVNAVQQGRYGWRSVKWKNRICERCKSSYTPISRTQRWCKICCPSERDSYLMCTYNINCEELNVILERASNCCEICQVPFSDERRYMIDHDHQTDQVRGVLCVPCNFALGMLDKQPNWVHAAQTYLINTRPAQVIPCVHAQAPSC